MRISSVGQLTLVGVLMSIASFAIAHPPADADALEKRVKALEAEVSAFAAKYVTKDEFDATMAAQAKINVDQAAINGMIQGEIKDLRGEFATAVEDLKKLIPLVEKNTNSISRMEGTIKEMSKPVGAVRVRNWTRNVQQIWIGNQLVTLNGHAGFGTPPSYGPIQVPSGTLVTRLVTGWEGARNWHIGPANSHAIVLDITP